MNREQQKLVTWNKVRLMKNREYSSAGWKVSLKERYTFLGLELLTMVVAGIELGVVIVIELVYSYL